MRMLPNWPELNRWVWAMAYQQSTCYDT